MSEERPPSCPICGAPMGKTMDMAFRLWWRCIYDHCDGAILMDGEPRPDGEKRRSPK